MTTTTTLNRTVLVSPTRRRSANRSSLLRLYLIRGVLAVLWAAAFAKGHDPLDALAITLLATYPLIDAVSSLIDYASMPRDAARRITAFNAVLSTLAAIGRSSALPGFRRSAGARLTVTRFFGTSYPIALSAVLMRTAASRTDCAGRPTTL